MGEIDKVMAMIDVAAGSATSYTETLAGMTKKLDQSKDREGLRAIVETLVHTAKELEVSNRQLEERLNAFSSIRRLKLPSPMRAKNAALSLMMTNIDRFKNFNDSYGQLTCDQGSAWWRHR
jgi:diguanylate cyclase